MTMFGVRSRIEGRRCSTFYEYLFSIVAVGTLVLEYAWLQFTVNDIIEAPLSNKRHLKLNKRSGRLLDHLR